MPTWTILGCTLLNIATSAEENTSGNDDCVERLSLGAPSVVCVIAYLPVIYEKCHYCVCDCRHLEIRAVILSAAKDLAHWTKRETVCKGVSFGLSSHFSFVTLNAHERIS